MIGMAAALRIRSNLRTDRPHPVSMQINITGRCPLHCWHCEKSAHRGGRDMPMEKLAAWLDLAAGWECPVLYTGGEPLVHNHWRRLLHDGADRGLDQKLITSGVTFPVLTEDDRRLLREAVGELMISVDAATPDVHDRLRGRSGLHDGIGDYLSRSVRPDTVWLVHVPDVEFSTVSPLLHWAAGYGVGVIVQPYGFESNYPHLAALSVKDDVRCRFESEATRIGETVRILAETADRLGVPSNLGEVALYISHYYSAAGGTGWYGHATLPQFVCSVPWQQVTVDEFGRVQPCVFLGADDEPDQRPSAMRWTRQALAFRELQLAGHVWPACRSCSCHFSSNFRNSLLMFPWRNRRGWPVALRKRLSRLTRRKRSPGGRRHER